MAAIDMRETARAVLGTLPHSLEQDTLNQGGSALRGVERMIDSYARVASANRVKFAKLRIVLARIHERGIDCLLLKGADLIPRLYRVWGLRPMADIDLLVHEEDLPAIDHVLKELGYRPQLDGNPAYVDPEQVLCLDIITTIWYVEDMDGIWQRADQRTIEGIRVKGMGSNDLLLYLTAYVVVHRGSLSPSFAQDLALLTRTEALDWSFILNEALAANLNIPLYHGLAYARIHSNAAVPQEILRQLAPSRLTEKFLWFLFQRLVTERQIPGIGFFLLFLTKPGSEKLRWLKTALFPPTAFLRYRYGARTETQPVLIRLVRPWYLLFQASLLSGRILFALLKPR